ncbi:hypothetical protein Mal52_45230 [Symmachiella dynata]|uniref:Leucine Rich repeats (2 copies) n=1 Tax=Symmachiella dynata TaxID=2527995 RepID=A0A517ZU66_9PLAN|nr:hypothetical protein [Symmachiella dynata]QDU46026.1 hypothetical protein Mal52_45230 [Symmachiella dynata]
MTARHQLLWYSIAIGIVILVLSSAYTVWHSHQIQNTVCLEVSKLGGTFTSASARQRKQTGKSSRRLLRRLSNPVAEIDLSEDTWTRVERAATRTYPVVTDADLKILQLTPTLKSLSLGGMPITDASIDTIVSLVQLEELDLQETKISEAGLQRIQDALPECKIRN